MNKKRKRDECIIEPNSIRRSERIRAQEQRLRDKTCSSDQKSTIGLQSAKPTKKRNKVNAPNLTSSNRKSIGSGQAIKNDLTNRAKKKKIERKESESQNIKTLVSSVIFS